MLYMNSLIGGSKVLLKLGTMLLHHGKCTLKTYAILDDGSENTILLHNATQQLTLSGQLENLSLRTVRHMTLNPGGCCTLVVDEEIAALLCKAL